MKNFSWELSIGSPSRRNDKARFTILEMSIGTQSLYQGNSRKSKEKRRKKERHSRRDPDDSSSNVV
jgi:hypothetical protein